MTQPADFPAFRKYTDGNTWFKLESPTQFTELKSMGKFFSISVIHTDKFPERMFLNDLLECTFETIKPATEEEFEAILRVWQYELKQVEF